MADGGILEGARPAGAEMARSYRIEDPGIMLALCGSCDRNLTEIETRLGVSLLRQGDRIDLLLREDSVCDAATAFEDMIEKAKTRRLLEESDILDSLRMPGEGGAMPVFSSRRKPVLPRSPAQKLYARNLSTCTLNFGIGPAGTGKTWMAVAAGVHFLLESEVQRLVLSRPAVEAGERLGFLPGDMKDKVDPYMQPLYDALSDLLPAKQIAKMIDDKVIEIAPLAFMRGRTLSNAFVLLDEAQNATAMQMKMFLTRLGEGSRMVITGDPSQIDLPRGVPSGLVEAERILENVEGVCFSRFTGADVVRHPLVGRILSAYEAKDRVS